MYPPPQASDFVSTAFIVFGLATSAGFVWLRSIAARARGESVEQRRCSILIAATLTVAWLIATWAISTSGIFAEFDLRPPPFALLLLSIVTVSLALGFGPIGTELVHGLPLWGLILAQSFRLPLELVMHQAAVEGVMPNQMTYTGANFDIVTGSTALVVGGLLASGHGGRRLALAWNILGAFLLANVVTIALLSTPTFGLFGRTPDRLNTWVAYPPFVWLPAVMVVAAFAGHIVVGRKLAASR